LWTGGNNKSESIGNISDIYMIYIYICLYEDMRDEVQHRQVLGLEVRGGGTDHVDDAGDKPPRDGYPTPIPERRDGIPESEGEREIERQHHTQVALESLFTYFIPPTRPREAQGRRREAIPDSQNN
jgi:hypothetical protein